MRTKYVRRDKKKHKEKKLLEIASKFAQSTVPGFDEFADLLINHKNEILNSFIKIQVDLKNEDNEKTTIKRRLSNDSIESFNNIPKDLKRITNGTSNFEYARQRILWAKHSNTHTY